jgi:aryl-alcohol dehydrogenase-like predicted oxidoreductase
MEQRLLGRTGTFVSEPCLGTMTFAREADEATSAKLLDRYLEAGGNFIDTAAPAAGARTLEQLEDNLGAVGWRLEPAHLSQLDEPSRLELEYPARFLADADRFP